ncbi:hypothetical protein ACFQ1I_01335 [Kitasatospora arboriphila]
MTEARYDDCSPDAYRTRAQTAAALSDAAAGFVREAGAERLVIGSPMVKGFFSFSTRGSGGPDGPAGVFPGDPTGFHDGATLPAAAGLTLLRAVLQREGAWCRLRAAAGSSSTPVTATTCSSASTAARAHSGRR